MSALREEGSLFADLGRHEVFTATKTYPTQTVADLALANAGDATEGAK
jgi:hypothetical protein